MASVYTQQKREGPEDYKLDDWNLNSTKRRLREKLEEIAGDVTLGNNVLGRNFAWDYLHYLEDGGEYGVEGFRKFVWNPERNMKRFFHARFESN